ncbi:MULTISPECIES: MerR family transcriptional regulator [unclassified Frankia]|uniref:MerR family transcriptional regulator n=1 Tax=unclassified Frankia TaxID=2632575 RepID=UPI002AD3B218|nr:MULTISPECIES: MerR family transcriptional regulator [unclassified Frankia]
MSAVTPSPEPAERNPRYTVAAVARRLGVAPATLRTWNRRYGLGPADHVSGTRRRYGPHDLARLEFMCRLTRDGIAPAEAARIARTTLVDDLPEPRWLAPVRAITDDHTHGVGPEPFEGGSDRGDADLPATTGERLGAAIPVDDDRGGPDEPAVADPAGSRGSGGRVLPLADAGIAARGLARAAMALDSSAVTRIMAHAVETDGVVAAWQELVCPVLVAVGRRWEQRGDAVDVEHLLSDCVAAVFRRVADRALDTYTRPVLLACTPAEQHSLALSALAAGLAERGATARILGAAVPVAALRTAVARTGPVAVFLWSQRRTSADAQALSGLPVTRPSTLIIVGGSGWRRATLPARVRHAGSLPEALDLLTGSPLER